MSLILLRKADKDDAAVLLEMYDSGNELFNADDRTPGNREMFEEILSVDDVIIASMDNMEVGFISYNIKKDYTMIDSLYVLKNYQRQGVGKKLLDHCLNMGSDRQTKLYALKVLKIAHWAIAFYLNNGFKIFESNSKVNQYNDILKGIPERNWSLLMYKILD